jgi:flagellin-like hook-associated protein FlgL
MAIPVLTNQHGLIGAEDLRRVTIELGGVMKRLQTGFRVNSAGEDTGALVQSNILSRALDTLQIASEQVAKAESTLTKMEDTVKRIYDLISIIFLLLVKIKRGGGKIWRLIKEKK